MAENVSSWVDLRDAIALHAPQLLSSYDAEEDLPDWQVWQRALEEATYVMWALTGGKVHGEECWSEVYSMRASCEIILLNGPIKEIEAVTLVQDCNATQQPMLDFCLTSAWSVNCCSGGFGSTFGYTACGRGVGVKIDYRTQSTLPPGTARNVAWLANEYVKASSGKACALPERITNISRQGVSWSLLDPQDFLDKRLTGTRLDQWLTTVRAVYPPATIIDPLKSCRLFSTKMTCGTAPFVKPGEYSYGTYSGGTYGYGDPAPVPGAI